MRGCGCLLLMILGSLATFGIIIFLALRPVGEAPPPVTVEGAASFDQKLATIMVAPGQRPGTVVFSEQELNSKLAQTMASAPAASPLKRIFVRLRPDNRLTAVGLGEVLGRPIGGLADLQVVSGAGVSVNIESARIGALPLPVALFTRVIGPLMQRAGVSFSAASAVPAAVQSARVEGTNLVVGLR